MLKEEVKRPMMTEQDVLIWWCCW